MHSLHWMHVQDTIVAPATGAGEAAIAVVRVSGAKTRGLAQEFFAGAPPCPRRVWHGDYVTAGEVVLDDVLFCFFPAPHSYTGEDVLEISGHGNPLIISRMIGDLVVRGCRLAEPGEFTKRAFLNGKMDLTSAEAVADIIRARSDRALEAAQRQLRGELGRRVDALVDRVLRTCAAIEAYIDFPDEDLPPEDRAARIEDLVGLLDEVNRLRSGRRQHQLLQEGARVVLLGEPNAGKSSLMNRFSGYERAIVSPEP
ncbi:MAG: tRNA modification GTPase, partial [Opitutaceae bacterium]